MITLPLPKNEIYKYSPHKENMLLLDSLEAYSFEDATLKSIVNIRPEAMFFNKSMGMVPAWISFEYIGQSIALLSGLFDSEKGGQPKIGFIMGLREFNIHSPGFAPGDKVKIEIKQIFQDGDVSVFEGTVKVNDKIAAEGTINTIAASDELIEQMKG